MWKYGHCIYPICELVTHKSNTQWLSAHTIPDKLGACSSVTKERWAVRCLAYCMWAGESDDQSLPPSKCFLLVRESNHQHLGYKDHSCVLGFSCRVAPVSTDPSNTTDNRSVTLTTAIIADKVWGQKIQLVDRFQTNLITQTQVFFNRKPQTLQR